MNRILLGTLILVVATGIAGCAGINGNRAAESRPMWDAYQKMADKVVEDPTFASYKPFLSQELLADIQSEPGLNLDKQVHFLAPPLWFEQVEEAYEASDVKGRQCLVVNGISVDGDPISAAVEYVSRNEEMKIRAAQIAFYEVREGLPAEPWCPIRPDEFYSALKD